ncbi:MAG: vitamin B12 dependent-methionine synthase activation domain-containing protein, partial [Gemmatimonadota bacterium]
DLIFDRREDALARFIEFYEEHSDESEERADPTAGMSAEEAIHWQILHRRREGIEDLVGRAIEDGGGDHEAAVRTLNGVLLPAMKEVGDRFGAGELILPFVLQSAEVMKRAVVKLETYLDQIEGQSKGTVVLATVFGDVHDIGKNLVGTILSNNGYTVHDLGKQVPVNTIIEKAEEVGADAIGLSALLVSTSKQMPLCVQELHARGLTYPVLVGGAAINPSFVRTAAFVENDDLYGPGLFYCKDAFEGLSAVEALVDPDRRVPFVEARQVEIREGVERRAALKATVPDRAPDRDGKGPFTDADVPRPAFYGTRLIERLPLEALYERIDLNTLYRLHWGAKNAKGKEWDRLLAEEFEPRLRRYQAEALASGWIVPKALYGIWPAAGDGDALVLYDPENPAREVARFDFPRQTDRDRLCLADYFRQVDAAERDVVALQIVTIGGELLEKSSAMMESGEYSEAYYLHGFGVRLAEASAEFVHERIREDLGIVPVRGLRYSWGYGACPDVLQHAVVYGLLSAREALGMELTSAGALVPELSTAALVVHHPRAKYFSV